MWMEWIPIPNKRCSHLKNTNAFIEYLQKGFVLRSEWSYELTNTNTCILLKNNVDFVS